MKFFYYSFILIILAKLQAAEPNFDETRKLFIASAQSDISTLSKEQKEEIHGLMRWLDYVQTIDATHISNDDDVRNYLDNKIISDKTRTLHDNLLKLAITERKNIINKLEEEVKRRSVDYAKKMLETQSVDELEALRVIMKNESEKNQEIANHTSSRSSISYEKLSAIIPYFIQLHSSIANNNHTAGLESLSQIRSLTNRIDGISSDDWNKFYARTNLALGIKTAAQLEVYQKELMQQILDPKNVSKLPEIQEQIQNEYEKLSRNNNVIDRRIMDKFEVLKQFTRTLEQWTSSAAQGWTPSNNAAYFMKSNSISWATLISTSDLKKSLTNYTVKSAIDGATVSVPLYLQLSDLPNQIKSIEELPEKMQILQSLDLGRNDSDYYYLTQDYQKIADTFLKLNEGTEFILTNIMPPTDVYSRIDSRSYLTTKKTTPHLAQLKFQLFQMLYERGFASQYPIDNMKELSLPMMVQTVLSKIKEKHDYANALLFSSFCSSLYPEMNIISPQIKTSLEWYLAGEKQELELGQIQLATMFYQKAAMISSDWFPENHFRNLLQKCKKTDLAGYEKGTQDAISINSGIATNTYNSVVIPAKKSK